jgi:type 1 glutamine amidotransferase
MKRTGPMKLILAFIMLVLSASFAIAASDVTAPGKIKVLVVTGGHGFERDPFYQMFSDNPEIDFTAASHSGADATVYERDDLLSFDVVVLYDMPKNISAAQKAKFMSLFDGGVGLVALHHSLCSYQGWPEYEQIIGGRYAEPNPARPGTVTEQVGYQHDVDIPVLISATNHPATAGLKDFSIQDEIYWGFRFGSDAMPLITTTHPKSGKPLGWARTQGKSRVVYLQLGHGPSAFNNENYRRLLRQSIRWVARPSRTTKDAAVQTSALAVAAKDSLLPRVFLLEAKYLQSVRERIHQGDKSLAPALALLRRDADEALKTGLVSVMDKKATPPSGDKHDYMSQAPYFWPDPKSSNGLPYIRRDGEHNPEIGKIPDHKNILEMPGTVETLALEWYFSSEDKYASKATELLRTWFLAPSTRMNPNLQFAQAVPGINTGRGTGLIESRALTRVVDAVGLLAGSPSWTDADQHGLEKWFAEFLSWMKTGKNGQDEAAAKNNHGTYYDAQVISFALFLGDTNFAAEVAKASRQKRIAVQIEPDGRQPLELVRTKSWSYSIGNLSGLMTLATLTDNVGVDLWNYETSDGRSIRKALDFLLPFASREKKWPYQQLGRFSEESLYPLLRKAADKCSDQKYQLLAAKLPPPAVGDRTRLFRPSVLVPAEIHE